MTFDPYAHGHLLTLEQATTMSLTKNNPAFDRMMEEAREYDELSHERYAEEQYMNRKKGELPKEEQTSKPATTVAQQPKR